MFVHKAMTALAETCGSVSFALPGARFHCVSFEGEVHRTNSMEEMKEFLRDEGNEEQVRFAIRTLWNRIEGRK